MAKMQVLRGRSSPSVQEELLSSLMGVEDLLEVTMREDKAPPDPTVRSAASDSLQSLDKLLVNLAATELLDQLVVVDSAICLHFPWCHNLAETERNKSESATIV